MLLNFIKRIRIPLTAQTESNEAYEIVRSVILKLLLLFSRKKSKRIRFAKIRVRSSLNFSNQSSVLSTRELLFLLLSVLL